MGAQQQLELAGRRELVGSLQQPRGRVIGDTLAPSIGKPTQEVERHLFYGFADDADAGEGGRTAHRRFRPDRHTGRGRTRAAKQCFEIAERGCLRFLSEERL